MEQREVHGSRLNACVTFVIIIHTDINREKQKERVLIRKTDWHETDWREGYYEHMKDGLLIIVTVPLIFCIKASQPFLGPKPANSVESISC